MAPTNVLTGPDNTSGFDGLRGAILRRIAPVLFGVGLDDHEIGCELSGELAHLRVTLTGPSVTESVRQALGVRVLDAVHAHGPTFGTIEVVCDFDETA